MFFWLEFGNAQKKMFNLNCRCDILRDHIARICLSECTEYIRTKTREVKSSLEAAELNLSVLEEQIKKKKQRRRQPKEKQRQQQQEPRRRHWSGKIQKSSSRR